MVYSTTKETLMRPSRIAALVIGRLPVTPAVPAMALLPAPAGEREEISS
jgi:hypothetical protein